MIARIVAQHIIAKKTKEKSKKDQLPKMPAVKPKTKKKLKPDVPRILSHMKMARNVQLNLFWQVLTLHHD